MNIMTLAIVGIGAYFLWQSGFLNKIAGGFGGGGGGSSNSNGNGNVQQSQVSSGNNFGTDTRVGTFASSDGSHATVCTNGNCQTFSGDNISVSCVDGRCHSNRAVVYNWSY